MMEEVEKFDTYEEYLDSLLKVEDNLWVVDRTKYCKDCILVLMILNCYKTLF